MALDPKTFGEAPAAMYLVELLNQRNNPVLTRKVSRALAGSRELINEIGDAHLKFDVLSTRTLSRLLDMLSNYNQTVATASIAKMDPFIAQITVNVLEGSVKTWKRRTQEAVRKFSNIARNTPSGMTVPYVLAAPIPNEKDASTLRARSKRYLKSKGKLDTLY